MAEQWSSFGANVPRFLSNGMLLSEGPRTNGNPNPRCVGAASPSTLPTGWGVANNGGLTLTVLGRTVVNGIPGVVIRAAGTASGTQFALDFNNSSSLAAAQSQPWTTSFFVMLLAAPLPPTGWTHRTSARTSGGGVVSGGTFTASFTPTSDFARVAQTDTLPADAGVAFVTHGMRMTLSSGADYDVTMFVGLPQMEQAAFASTPIMPADETLGASSRGADAITASVASLFPAGAGTVLGTMAYDNLPGTGNTFDFLQLDAGDANNRFLLRILPTSNVLRLVSTVGGSSSTADAGATSLGSTFRWGISWDGAGRVAACLNGAAPVSVTGAFTGSTTLRLLAGISLAAPTFARFGPFSTLPFAVPDAALQTRVAALQLP